MYQHIVFRMIKIQGFVPMFSKLPDFSGKIEFPNFSKVSSFPGRVATLQYFLNIVDIGNLSENIEKKGGVTLFTSQKIFIHFRTKKSIQTVWQGLII